jgi:hypothetical protein
MSQDSDDEFFLSESDDDDVVVIRKPPAAAAAAAAQAAAAVARAARAARAAREAALPDCRGFECVPYLVPDAADAAAEVTDKGENLAVHFGDLGKGRDTALNRMTGSVRSTGHYGYGTYFLSPAAGMRDRMFLDRPMVTCSLAPYRRLYRPANGNAARLLHRVLESLNMGESIVDTLPSERDDEDDVAILAALQTLFGDKTQRELVCAWRAASELRLRYDAHDSKSTRFMKCLGYQGIDVRGIPVFDTAQFGTVVYDYRITGREIRTPPGGGGSSGAGSAKPLGRGVKRGRPETGGRQNGVITTKFCNA